MGNKKAVPIEPVVNQTFVQKVFGQKQELSKAEFISIVQNLTTIDLGSFIEQAGTNSIITNFLSNRPGFRRESPKTNLSTFLFLV